MNLEKEVFEISLNDIMPNRFQPREIFDDTALQELATSIKEHGVIQPIIVRKVGDKYEIVAGERRFRASQLAGKTTIPSIVKDIDDKETAKIALLENLQRKDLTPIEEARTYQTILKLDNLTQEELATSLGKSQSTIANKLRLLNLSEEVQTALLNEKISERHARSLLNIENKDIQKDLLEKVIMNRMTVKQLDDEILKITGKPVEEISDLSDQNLNIGISQPTIDEAPLMEQPIVLETATNELKNIILTPQVPITEQSVIEPVPAIPTPVLSTTNEIKNIIFKPETPEIDLNSAIAQPQEPVQKNIFDSLRVEEKPQEPAEEPISSIIPKIETVDSNNTMTTSINSPSQNEYSNIYDLRFAINNVRQAVQNTEKFGFLIDVEEFDFENIYQIVIKIDKNK